MSFGVYDAHLSLGETQVLRGFTLELPARGAICLFGPSGCGKSSVVHLLAGLITPQEGRVVAPARVGVVFQEDRLLPWTSALGNVCFPPEAREEEAHRLLVAMGMGPLAHRSVAKMSGGQRRRVAIARALALPCDALLLDEPFRGLDAQARLEAVALLREVIAHKPCLLVTHDPLEAELLGAPLLGMDGGGVSVVE